MVQTTTTNLYENTLGSGTGQLTFASFGSVTANSTSAVTVSDPGYTVGDVILFGNTNFGGTPGTPYVFAGTTGTGFQIKSTSSDTGIYYWVRFTPAAQQTA